MKRFMTLVAVLITIAASAQGDKNFIDQNYIEVNGRAEMEVTPDLIYLKILINEKDSKNKTALAESEKQMIKKLESLGVNITKDLTIKDLSSDYRFYLLNKTQILLAKEYQLVVHNGATAGKVFIELEKIGISNIRVDRVDHSRIEEFRREVKVNAVKAAKDKASALAKAIDQSVGRALYIQEMDFTPYRAMANANVMLRGYSSDSSPEDSDMPALDFEKIHLEYSVMARFELK